MFDYIKGFISFISPHYVVIEHNKIGYQIYTPNPYSFEKSNMEIQIFIYQHVREDINVLYGFKTCEEREMFIKLINVSGIGPKGALAILAGGNIQKIVQSIEDEDEGFLIKFPGVGKKTARQMILDLKGKLDLLIDPNSSFTNNNTNNINIPLDEAIEALKSLGYKEGEVKKTIPYLQKETLTTEQYIKKALQFLLINKKGSDRNG